MRSPTRILLALAGLIAVVTFAILASRQPEPLYQGKPLSFWLEDYGGGPGAIAGSEARQLAHEAVRQMGAEALPFVLDRLRAKRSRVELSVINLAARQSIFRFRFNDLDSRRIEAANAFVALDVAAKPAIPALRSLLKDDLLEIRSLSAFILGEMGPAAIDAVPDLITGINDRENIMRKYVLVALIHIHEKPELTIPAFVGRLGDRDGTVQEMADSALRAAPAKDVVPVLLKFLGNPQIRPGAIRLLKEIDPEAATRAGLN